MRSREMLGILNGNIPYLKISATTEAGKYLIPNFNHLVTAINNIAELGFLRNELNSFNNESLSSVFYDKSEKIYLNADEYTNFKSRVESIREKSVAVRFALTETITKQDMQSVSIKLPHYTQLSQIATFIKDIDTITSQVLSGDFQANVKFQNFDTGSEWIEIVIDNKEAFLFFGQVVSSAIKFVREQFSTLIQAQKVVEMIPVDEPGEAAKKIMIEALQENVKAQARLNAKMLMKDFDIKESDNDYHVKLTYSITKLAELLQKGTEVHTALNAPEEIKEAYPDPKQLFLVDQEVKFLSEKTEEDLEKNNDSSNIE